MQAYHLSSGCRYLRASAKAPQKGLIRAPNMKVTIKEWNAVASWRWDMPEDDVCGICRVQFDGTCPTCKYPGDDCALCMLCPHVLVGSMGLNNNLVIGTCGHSFHMVCNILSWSYSYVLIIASIAFLRGFSKIHPRDYVRCAGKVGQSSSYKDFSGS